MVLLHKGTPEEGRGLLVFLFGNALVEKEDADAVDGHTKMKEVDPLNYQQDLTIIRKALSKSKRQIRFVSSPVTSSEVQKRLAKGCQMLHFAVHGFDEYLGFEANEAMHCGVLEPLSAEKLKQLFEAFQPELVFLGSCCSEAHGNALVEAGVPNVVAVRSQKKVEDETARIFCSEFYHALIGCSHTVKKAFELAVGAVNKEKPNAGEKFLLLPENGDHDVRIFDGLPSGKFSDETPQLPVAHRLPSARKTYFGAVEFQHAVSLLQNPNAACVSIVGEAEIGKTERALQVAYYMRERRIFSAIFFAGFKQVVSECPSPPTQSSRPEVESFYTQYFCQQIASALGLDREFNASANQLWESMCQFANINNTGRTPFKALLILDGVDALYEDREKEAHTGLVKIIDELCRITPNLKFVLTCKEQLLQETDVPLSNTKELVHEVRCLRGRDPSLLLWHLSLRDGESDCEDIDAQQGCSFAEVMKRRQNVELMKIANGHPGMLCHVGPLLSGHCVDEISVKQIAFRYRAQLKNKRRKSFWESRASDIASNAGLKLPWCIRIWVGATKTAEAEGWSVKGDTDDAHYYSVPLKYIWLNLRTMFSQLQLAGGNKEDFVDDHHRARVEGSGRSFSSNSCHYSGVGLCPRGRDLGYGYTSTFKPRNLTEHDFDFVRDVLRRSSERGDLDAAGEHTEEDVHSQSDSEDNEEVITLETFVNFCTRWWEPVVDTVSRMLNDWTAMKPTKVHGFISRSEAEHVLLSSGKAGVFLLRFSGSRPGLLVLTFTSQGTSDAGIKHSLVTVKQDRSWMLHYDDDTSAGISYPSLRDLVFDKGSLTTLYPDVEKTSAFETSS